MKSSNGSPRRVCKLTDARRRVQLLAAFDRSGLSASVFARRHGIRYTTFCGWRQRQAKASPGFVQVELPPPAAPIQLLIELGAHTRLRITSTDQIQLAARLLQQLNAPASC